MKTSTKALALAVGAVDRNHPPQADTIKGNFTVQLPLAESQWLLQQFVR